MTSNTVQVGVKCIRTSRIVNHDQNLFDTVGLFQKLGPRIAHLKKRFYFGRRKSYATIFIAFTTRWYAMEIVFIPHK